MTAKTVRRLNALNLQFYQDMGKRFSRTRQQGWRGWQRCGAHIVALHQRITTRSLRVLDLGCGNGRFLDALNTWLPKGSWEYVGMDHDDGLLAETSARMSAFGVRGDVQKVDIVQTLLDGGEVVLSETFDVIVAFGALHHIPSRALRKQFVIQCLNGLQSPGLFCLSAWHPTRDATLGRKLHPLSTVGISGVESEPGDWIMSWENLPDVWRYVHDTSDDELLEILACAGANTNTTTEQYEADGKTNHLNTYLLCSHDAQERALLPS